MPHSELYAPVQEAQHYHSSLYDDQTTWKLHLSPKPASTKYEIAHPFHTIRTANILKDYSDPFYEHRGTCPEHLQTLNLLLNRWPQILDVIHPQRLDSAVHPLLDPVAYPEVFLRYPIFDDSAGRSLDFLGLDENGALYVIEVGRRHKFSQIEKQLYLTRLLFPNHSVYGLVAKYRKQGPNNYRLFFRYH